MLSIVLDAMTPRSKPMPDNITTVDTKKHLKSNDYSVTKKQENQTDERTQESKNYKNGLFDFKTKLVWPNIIGMTLLHVGSVYALLTFNIFQHKMLTFWVFFTFVFTGFGITGGIHRLWSHRSYKAKLPLRIFLLAGFLSAGQNSVFNWVRDHRVHHKYSETDADPHNTHRGFFFAHMGWLMMKKHPEVLRRGKQVDMSDILSDPLLQFAEKHFQILKLLGCFIIPVIIPVYCWNEDWYTSIMSQIFIRYPLNLNATWSVNSFAHMWGYRSYDKSIRPVENHIVAFASLGEGWHNYHHAFPWDYKAAEFGTYGLNWTNLMIEGFAKIGWAYDLKKASDDLVRNVVQNRGDGSHAVWGHCEN